LRHRSEISSNRPLIIGHRGASAVAPENTLAAFARAFADGADGIELDVRLASDGVPVVIHDATLRRTGLVNGSVEQMTSAQLANLDVGSWFNHANPILAREKYTNERVPTLVQVFELCSKRDGLLYVELKTDLAATDELVQSVADLIRQPGFITRSVVVSFDHAALAAMKSFDSSIRTGALFAPRRGVRGWRAQTILSAAADSAADEILLHRLLARRRLVEQFLERDFPVVVWTVDDREWLARAHELGIHALITNDPAQLSGEQ
jgi:glycerophosphoryl diester phosphodiesterase